MKQSLARIAFSLACLVMSVAGRAQAQDKPGRWMFEAGVSGVPYRPLDSDLFAGAAVRIATTGPLEWSAGATVYGIATVHHGTEVSVLEYCLDGCHIDESKLTSPVTAGVTVRLVGLPGIFNRIIPEVGTGGYYARWTNLPAWETERSPLLTGYRLYALGLRLTRRVGVSIGGTQFRNVRHRDDRTPTFIALQVRLP